MAISIWKASGWRAEHALQTLKDKCLVDLQPCFDGYHGDPEFVLRMHDHLRDLGRDMADNEMSNSRRLWRPTNLSEIENIVKEKEGKNFRYFNEIGSQMACCKSTDLQWLQFRFDCGYEYIPEWIPLQNLHTLRLRGVSSARLWQTGDRVPLKLKELDCWIARCHIPDLNELVSSFGMLKHLESLYLGSDFQIQSFEWNCLLKYVRELTNLKTLKLELNKVEGEFTLSNRGGTTDDQFLMRSLEAITLYDAEKTRKVSISGQLCPTLKSLKLYFMEDLIEMDLTGITTLECLLLVNCDKLREVSVNNLLNLEMFRTKYCPAMTELPNFGRLSCLKRIYISRCKNVRDISAIEGLKGLKRIWIAYCPELKNIKAVEQLKGLKRIWIDGCEQLEGVICFKELKELKRIFIGQCARLQNIEGIEFLVRLESIIIAACPKLQNIKGIEELKGLKEMIISDTSTISCVERLQRLPLELTILVGRPAMSVDEDEESFLNKDKIGNTLSMADGFCEAEYGYMRREKIEEMIHSVHKKSQNSLSTFIFCALLDRRPSIGSDICNGTSIMLEGRRLNDIHLCGDGKKWIYTCVVNEERLSKYDSWMPSYITKALLTTKAFLMRVKKGEERKTLHILQTLFAQLRLGEYQETTVKLRDWIKYGEIEYDDVNEYVDEVEEYDSDDDDHNEDVS
ncbi:hypothetical protein SUGI_0797530 [Cryptomeria japonica]|nr:hypothetical protein SUGI_0797530 [Cryptomeria japonica]